MEPSKRPDPDADIRAMAPKLRRTAMRRRPGGSIDGEDISQNAWIRVLAEQVRADAPPLEVRAYRALRQADAEDLRRSQRVVELRNMPLLEGYADRRQSSALQVVELAETIREIAGDDALEALQCRAAGMTETEIGSRPGWTPEKAHAALRRLRRSRSEITKAIVDQTGGKGR